MGVKVNLFASVWSLIKKVRQEVGGKFNFAHSSEKAEKDIVNLNNLCLYLTEH